MDRPAPPAGEVWRFDAIGTAWEVVTDAVLPAAVREEMRAEVASTIDGFDRDWSRFRADSTVTSLAAHPRSIDAPLDAVPMLDLYAELSSGTGGAVNPLVGESLAQLGYDASYSLRGGEPLPAPDAWREVLTWQGGSLELRAPALIDVGALGKGRLVDLVAEVVARIAPGGHVVDAGGDMIVHGRPQRVGLEHPFDPRRAIGVWEVTDAALCASAVGRRAWGDGLHHVLDARTGMPVRTIAATWAVAPTAMRADAVATALFFDGGPRLAFEWGVEWVRMTTDGRVEWSPGCRADLFTRAASVER